MSQSAENDAPVPDADLLAATLWKCHRTASLGPGDGSVTWWTLQPVERKWWQDTAAYFVDALALHPEIGRVIPPGACLICGGPIAEVGTSRCYEAHGVIPPVVTEGGE